ncbi:MAG: VWA domain-containing protein, partial [Phycisphaerae bacterium]|nr:VWA domain-containing protein [Phycisphaerae bacterium]
AAPGGDPSGDSAEPGAANAESRQRSGTRGDQEAESTDSEPASRQAPGTHGGQDGETAPAPASDTPHGSRRGSLIGEALTEAIAEAVRQTDGDGHYRVFTKAHDRIELVPAADAAEAEALLANGRDAARRLRRGLTNALRSAEKRWWRHDQLRGELSPRSLYRLATDRPRLDIFRVRSVVQGQSTAVSILLDASGSMSRRKMEVARSALAVLLQALGDLGVATEALTFTTGNAVDIAQAVQQSGLDAGKLRERYGRLSNLEIGLVKAFAEPVRPALARLPAVRGSGLTPLGEGMQIAAARLVVRRENRRILLVLTDGKAGCEGSSESARRHAQAMAERIMRAGIELIGVGILDENIREVVAESIVIQKIEDLPAQLCKLLGRTLKKGLRHVG